jgi:hypothetical protein
MLVFLWPLDRRQILADGGTLGKRKPWDSGKFGWSRFDQDVVGVRRWRVRCGLPTNQELAGNVRAPPWEDLTRCEDRRC